MAFIFSAENLQHELLLPSSGCLFSQNYYLKLLVENVSEDQELRGVLMRG